MGMALLWATEAESRANTLDCLCAGRTMRLRAGGHGVTEAESCANILESLCAGGTMHLRAGGDVVAMGDRG